MLALALFAMLRFLISIPIVALDGWLTARTTRRASQGKSVPMLLWPLLISFNLLVVGVRLFRPDWLCGPQHWPETLLVILAALAVVGMLSRELPFQNVVAAFCFALLAAAGLVWSGAQMGEVFGQNASEVHSVNRFSWVVPMGWVSILLICRGVARLALQRLRSAANYGYYVLGLTVLLSSLLALNLSSLLRLPGYASGQSVPAGLSWFHNPLINGVAWAIFSGVVLVLITPWLINKSPASQRLIFTPFWMWLALQVLLLVAALQHQLWAAALTSALQILVVSSVIWLRLEGSRKIFYSYSPIIFTNARFRRRPSNSP